MKTLLAGIVFDVNVEVGPPVRAVGLFADLARTVLRDRAEERLKTHRGLLQTDPDEYYRMALAETNRFLVNRSTNKVVALSEINSAIAFGGDKAVQTTFSRYCTTLRNARQLLSIETLLKLSVEQSPVSCLIAKDKQLFRVDYTGPRLLRGNSINMVPTNAFLSTIGIGANQAEQQLVQLQLNECPLVDDAQQIINQVHTVFGQVANIAPSYVTPWIAGQIVYFPTAENGQNAFPIRSFHNVTDAGAIPAEGFVRGNITVPVQEMHGTEE